MKLTDISRATVIALAIVGGVLLTPQTATAQAAITEFHFDINTKGDNKDKGESISFQVIRNDTEIIYDSGWIHGDLNLRDDSYNDWRGTPRIPITLADAPNLKLRVEKQKDKGWKVSFRVRANQDTVVLVSDTPEVLFGKRNTINIDKPLQGADGIKATHLDGGSIHVFAFTARP